MTLSLLDFNDSFTYNIASELEALGLVTEVIPYHLINTHLRTLVKKKGRHTLILGPGPGHVNDYQFCWPLLRELMAKKHILKVGICLGHQILCSLLGMEIIPSKRPIHGRKIFLKIPAWPSLFPPQFVNRVVEVQRYNSLATTTSLLSSNGPVWEGPTHLLYDRRDEEIMMVWNPEQNILAYQFHPESIGTSYPALFFRPLKDFLYNERVGEWPNNG